LGLLLFLAAALAVFALVVRHSLEGGSKPRLTANSGLYIAPMTALTADPGWLISSGANYFGPFLVPRLTNSDHLAVVALLNCGMLLVYMVVVRAFDLDAPSSSPPRPRPEAAHQPVSVNKEILAFACAAFMAAYSPEEPQCGPGASGWRS
jgi:hypothetical protein